MNIYNYNNLFLDNKYTKWYYQIIIKAQSENRVKLKRTDSDYIYYEKHHILPKCKSMFPEYSNLKEHPWNSVLLTPREHYICHMLLINMTTSKAKSSMATSFKFFKLKQYSYYKNIKKYIKDTEETRIKKSLANSGENNGMYGKTHNIKTKTLIGNENRHRIKYTNGEICLSLRQEDEIPNGFYKGILADFSGENNGMYGKTGENNPNIGKKKWNNGVITTMSKECPGEDWVKGELKTTKQKISESIKNRGGHTGSNNPMYNKLHSLESKTKNSESNKGYMWFNNGEINIRSKTERSEGWVRGVIRKKLKDQTHLLPYN